MEAHTRYQRVLSCMHLHARMRASASKNVAFRHLETKIEHHEGCCSVRFERIVYGAYFRQASYKDVRTADRRLERILHVRSPASAPFSALCVATLFLGVPPRILPEFAHLDLWTCALLDILPFAQKLPACKRMDGKSCQTIRKIIIRKYANKTSIMACTSPQMTRSARWSSRG